MKKRLIGILSLIGLTGSYWVLRNPLYSLQGMKEWPLILLIAGILVISVSGILFARKFLPIFTAAGYAAGFALGHWFQSDYGHSQNSLWIIWTCSFLASVLIGIGIELFAKNQEDTP